MRTKDTLPKSKVGSVVYIHFSLKSLYFRLSAYKPSACNPTLNKYLSMLAAQCWLDATLSQVLSNKNVTKTSVQEFEFDLRNLIFTGKNSIYHVLHAILGSIISQEHFN